MVSVKPLEGGEYCLVKTNASSEQTKFHQMPPRGIKTPLYRFGSTFKGKNATIEEEQSLLDSLLLSHWEDCSWKGQLNYDVTMCEIQIVRGRKKFIAQLNEKWNTNILKESEKGALQPSGPFKPSYMKTLGENLFLCVTNGENECSEFIPSTTLPKDGMLVMVNVNPVEYGHVFLVPYDINARSQLMDRKMLNLAALFATEINSCSFRLFFDHHASTIHSDHVCFQTAYFANPLPVELLPTVCIHGSLDEKEVNIYEFADYPLKALLFTSVNLELLVGVVSEICSCLQHEHNIVFNLLVIDSATKMYLFPQATGSHLSTWECGGYFVYNSKSEFESASEAELSELLASASLDDKSFEALKQLCFNIIAA